MGQQHKGINSDVISTTGVTVFVHLSKVPFSTIHLFNNAVIIIHGYIAGIIVIALFFNRDWMYNKIAGRKLTCGGCDTDNHTCRDERGVE